MDSAQVTYNTSGAGAGVVILWFIAIFVIAVIPYWSSSRRPVSRVGRA
jgi:hypothetical protein